jgi:hypothetical protein
MTMRIHYSETLVDVVVRNAGSLFVKVKTASNLSTTDPIMSVASLPRVIMDRFNADALPGRVIDFVSDPIVEVPDEFEFTISVEHLDRLSREELVERLPLEIQIWSYANIDVADVWLGDQSRPLSKSRRSILREEMSRLRALPTEGKVFVIDEAFSPGTMAALEAGIIEMGGIIRRRAEDCDYYIAHDPATVPSQVSNRCRILSRQEFRIMLSRR